MNNDISSTEKEVYDGEGIAAKPEPPDKDQEQTQIVELKERMWTRGFLLLGQGQLVSLLGDAAYAIALGFWVLSVTGSTALMGTLMASSTLPGLLVGPFAGVAVDRGDRRFIMVLMDVIRGLSVIFIGIEGFTGMLRVWMVFVSGIILSLCGAFFQPAVYSAIPDIVPESKIVNANSVFSMLSLGSTTIGNSAGGFLYQLLGAPFMFLFNGISFIFSGISLIFVKVPQNSKKKEQHFSQNFCNDFKKGLSFVWNFKGLRYIFLMGTITNFFFGIVAVLLLPLFQKTANLGPAKYGIFMAVFMAGMFLGATVTSVFNLPPSKRMFLLTISLVFNNIALALITVFQAFALILALAMLAGIANSLVNVFMKSSMQFTVPKDMRGKVFSLRGTVKQGFAPLAMAIGGVLGEFLPIRVVISACCIMSLLISLAFMVRPQFKRFINYDPKAAKLQDIM
ncbi:MFS transporter [Desulfosporosinus sp. PR]|uniref:MFS transporter n=1 Tax=Candidatus Desulfosporosinus nitrosoreducens TaxID=3401928 RepID=UPI0027FFFAF7|nr:MFS transporter [Desulfosporosinus sp. PR]MDQ7095707.1 MFS transporter [Desulfosporosinus sp. PR]